MRSHALLDKEGVSAAVPEAEKATSHEVLDRTPDPDEEGRAGHPRE